MLICLTGEGDAPSFQPAERGNAMGKKRGATVLQSFTVTVTPTRITPSGSKNVLCDLGPPAIDNGLFLDRDTDYDITFALAAGSVPQVTRFASTKPFCNQPKNCPPKLPGGKAQKPCTVTDDGSGNGGASIIIHVSASGQKGLTYYRLNF